MVRQSPASTDLRKRLIVLWILLMLADMEETPKGKFEEFGLLMTVWSFHWAPMRKEQRPSFLMVVSKNTIHHSLSQLSTWSKIDYFSFFPFTILSKAFLSSMLALLRFASARSNIHHSWFMKRATIVKATLRKRLSWDREMMRIGSDLFFCWLFGKLLLFKNIESAQTSRLYSVSSRSFNRKEMIGFTIFESENTKIEMMITSPRKKL